MGPTNWPAGEPGREGPRFAVVSSAEVGAEPGMPISADYWVNREPGETWTAFRARRQVEAAEDRADSLEAKALHLRAEAGLMRIHAGLAAGPLSIEYQRGRAETLASLAGMHPDERGHVLAEVAAMIEAAAAEQAGQVEP